MAPTPTATLSDNPVKSMGSRHTLFLSITFALLGLATVFVMLRLYARYFVIHRVGVDDWVILVGLLAEWGLAVMNLFQVRYGTGNHINTVTIDEFLPTLRYWFAYQIIYPIVLLFIKLSILSFYRRISPQRWYRYSVNGVIAFVVAWTFTVVFAHVFECPSPSTAWSLKFPQECVNLPALYYSAASINIASDLAILLLPIPVLCKLEINRRRKVALTAIFLVGSVAVAGSIARLWAVWKYQHTTDVSYDAIFILLFSHIEITLAMMCSCAPALKPLFKTFASPFTSRSGDSKGMCSTSPDAPGAVSAGVPIASVVPQHSSLARNRAIFENRGDSPRRSVALESRVVEITAGTPYYTPPLEFAMDSGSDIEVENDVPSPATTISLSPSQLGKDSQPSKSSSLEPMIFAPCLCTDVDVLNSTIHSPPPTGPSRLTGEYTAVCSASSSQSLDRSSDEPAAEQQPFFAFIHRGSFKLWQRQSRAASPVPSESPLGSRNELRVNVEQDVRVDYESMTAGEQARWERKRSRLDAVDSLW
ncbi:hypothetical protein ABW21_db0203180 [Orbilia brochopaga]|nr:hypothetical protein ABW21_db0203180 [Drechslerella brochopaga]